MNEFFRKFANKTSELTGTAWAFIVAFLVIIIWATTGPVFHYSDTWQLVINTGTTIITFLMVFLIQNTQNRDAKAIHLKLDELVRATQGARNTMINLDKMSDAQLKELQEEYKRICEVGDSEEDNQVHPIDKVMGEAVEAEQDKREQQATAEQTAPAAK